VPLVSQTGLCMYPSLVPYVYCTVKYSEPSFNPRCANLILYGIDRYTGTRPCKVTVNKQNRIYIYCNDTYS
jgi:hypothetical protein